MHKKSSWIQLDCPNVEPRHLHTSILYQNYIISFGGLSFGSRSNKYLSHLSIFDISSYKWLDTNPATNPQFSFKGKKPQARYGHTACLINENQILVHGGIIEEEQTSEIIIFTLNFDKGISINCEIFSDEDEALQRSNHSAHVYGEYMYVFGGLVSEEEEALNELWKLDLKNYTWTQCEHTGDIPSRRSRHASVIFNNKMYIFGGRSNLQPYTRTNDLYSLDFETLKWTRIDCKGELPSPRNGAGMVQNQGVLYLFGGAASSEECCNDLYTMDLNGGDFTWKTMDIKNKFPDTRANHAMLWHDNGFFVIEGANYEQTFNDLFYLKISQAQKPKMSGFQAEISQAFLDDKYADVTFIVEKENFPGHKAILTNRSPYFAKLFKEGDKKEIEIIDCKAKTFKGILEYFYCGKIKEMTNDLARDLWKLGNKWEEKGVEEYCEAFFERNINEEEIVSIGEIGVEMKSKRLMENVVDYVIMNMERMKERGDLERIPEEIMFDVLWKLQEKKKKCKCKENKLVV